MITDSLKWLDAANILKFINPGAMSQYDYPRPFDPVFTVTENLFPVFAILYCRTPNFSTGSVNYNLYNKKYQGLRGKKTMSWGGKAPE
jgi:hypothetical protein